MHRLLSILALLAVLLACPALAIIDGDGDGMSDLWEGIHGFSTADDGTVFFGEAPGADPDGDGETNLEEALAGTDPFDPSAYRAGQGVPSGEFGAVVEPAAGTGAPELLWWGIAHKNYHIESGPDLSQWAAEGLPGAGANGELSFLPLATASTRYWRVVVADLYSDLDALSDWEENELGTSPTNEDHEGDGMWDDYEVLNGLDPFTDDTGGDADGDGLSNGAENALGLAAGDPDSDNDGLWDGYENEAGTNPHADDDPYAAPGPTGLVVFTPGVGARL